MGVVGELLADELLQHLSEDLGTSETSISPRQWVCSDFCGQGSNICIYVSAQGIWYHESSVSEDKCVIGTVVLVVILVLIPFFSAYRLLVAIDCSKLEILTLL